MSENLKKYSYTLIAAIFCVSGFFIASNAMAIPAIPSIGPNNPSLAANDFSNGAPINWLSAWTGHTLDESVSLVDGNTASSYLDINSTSQYLKLSGFNFSIPANVIINGISVNIYRRASVSSKVKDVEVELMSGSEATQSRADIMNFWPTAITGKNYGGVSDTWGKVWTPEEINNPSFGLIFSAKNYDLVSKHHVYADGATITIYYTNPQKISVTKSAPVTSVYGSTFQVSAISDSGLDVSVTAWGGCSVNESGIATMTSGTTNCLVHYNQAGNSFYAPAEEIIETIVATRENPLIVWNNPDDVVAGTVLDNLQLNATATANGMPVDGNFIYSPEAGTVVKLAGSNVLSAHFYPSQSEDYNDVDVAPVILNVLAGGCSNISVSSNVGTLSYGSTAQFFGQCSDKYGNQIPGINFTWAVLPENAGTIDNNGLFMAGKVGQAVVTATGGNAGTNTGTSSSFNITPATPNINWDNPADISYGMSLDGSQLNATASFNGTIIPGNFYYTPDFGTVMPFGPNQNLNVSFVPGDSEDFNSVGSSSIINVGVKNITVSGTDMGKIYDGTNDIGSHKEIVLSSGDILAGDDVLLDYESASFDGSEVGAHTVLINGISMGGNDAYKYNLINATVSIAGNISQQSAIVSFDEGNVWTATYDGNPIQAIKASAIGNDNKPVNVKILYDGSLIVPTDAGVYSVVAYADDPNYAGQTDPKNLVIGSASQTIKFDVIDDKNSNDPDFSVFATSDSGLGVLFDASGECSVSGNVVHIAGPGICTIIASQPGNNNYIKATEVSHLFNIADKTAPVISGLSNDTSPVKSKTWNWTSDDDSAIYRFSIDQNLEGSLSGDYSDIKTANKSSGDGIYYLHVQAKDSTGNESLVITVSAVLDNTSPVITVSGSNPFDMVVGSAYTDAGASAKDGKLAVDVSSSILVNSDSVGTYAVIYTAKDSAGNIATASRTVNVNANTSSSSGGGGGGGSNSSGGESPAPAVPVSSQTSDIKPGDINKDGFVDDLDFSIMMDQWGQSAAGLSADVNSDSTVDELDFAILMANWS